MFFARKLEEYLKIVHKNRFNNILSQDAEQIKVFNLKRLGGGVSNRVFFFSLAYLKNGTRRTKKLILKLYPENEDPVLKMDFNNEDPGKCLREFQVLKSLELCAFPAPRAYICENNCSYFGFPFVIMSYEKMKEKSINHLGLFAKTLAQLHNLKWEKLKIECLKPPHDKYEFAKRQIIHFENLLNYLSNDYNVDLTKDFNQVIRWLRDNENANFCDQYSLIHGDFCPGNAFLNEENRMIVTDWEWADVGDPAHDVGVAYHYMKIADKNNDKALAYSFIVNYMMELNRDITQRLKFYQVISAIKLLIFYRAVSLSPALAHKYYGVKSVLVFPALRWFLRPWPQYLEKFLRKIVNI